MKGGRWLISKPVDICAMLLPVWVCWGIAFLLPSHQLHADLPVWIFVVVVIGIECEPRMELYFPNLPG